MSCLSTIGSSWADLWAVDKLQTWMKPTLFYQDFPNLPRTIHRSILSSLPSADCQSSFSRVLNLGLRGKNKLTQGILFGNIQELAAVVQLCWPCSLSLRKDSLDEWAETCPCLFPRKRPKFQAQAHYSPRAQKFHLHRGFHWITLNSFRGEKKKKNLFSKIPLPPTGQGLAQGGCQQQLHLHLHVWAPSLGLTGGAATKPQLRSGGVTPGLLQPRVFPSMFCRSLNIWGAGPCVTDWVWL